MTTTFEERDGAYLAAGPEIPEGLLLGFTTRLAGDMTDPEARARLAGSLGMRGVLALTQVHSVDLLPPDPASEGAAADGWAGELPPGLLLTVRCADCLPLLLWSEGGDFGAAVHAGWRGATAGIAALAVKRLPVAPGTLHALLGPAIGGCCYEVGEEVARAARHSSTLRDTGEGKYRFDLAGYVAANLTGGGVAPEKIHRLGHCTVCRPDLYASHRANGARARQCGFIGRRA